MSVCALGPANRVTERGLRFKTPLMLLEAGSLVGQRFVVGKVSVTCSVGALIVAGIRLADRR